MTLFIKVIQIVTLSKNKIAALILVNSTLSALPALEKYQAPSAKPARQGFHAQTFGLVIFSLILGTDKLTT